MPWWATLLTSIGLPTIIASAYIVVNKKLELRADSRNQRTTHAREDARRDEQDMTLARAAAEKHIRWDYAMLAELRSHRSMIDELHKKLGLDPITWPDLPEPPAFFSVPPPAPAS